MQSVSKSRRHNLFGKQKAKISTSISQSKVWHSTINRLSCIIENS
uniref:Alpha-mannosidase n=1 Tax=Rhizophora mucronata TaxID=61149 RepID=A0A2P2MM49_RHIMU